MPQPLKLRLAIPGDSSRVIELLNRTFRTPVDQATWDWYCTQNPLGTTRSYLGLDSEDRAAGLYAFTPISLRIQQQRVAGSFGHHLCLRKDYQGGAALIALSKYALEGETLNGVKLALGLPNRNSHVAQKALMKWADFCFLECVHKLAPSAREHSCDKVERFGSAFDEFHRRLTSQLEFQVEKNADWMNWRYCQRPDRPYTTYFATGRDEEPAGYIVLKRWREPDGYKKAHIVDLQALDDIALAELIAAAETYAAGCDELNLWVAPRFPYRAHLEAAGYVVRDSVRQPMIARILRDASLEFPLGRAAFGYADGDFVY